MSSAGDSTSVQRRLIGKGALLRYILPQDAIVSDGTE